MKAIAAADAVPIAIGDPILVARIAWPAPAPVILQAATNEVGLPRVHAHVVELADGQVTDEIPTFGPVVAQINPAVAAGDQMIGFCGVNPHGVEIAVDFPASIAAESLAAVVGSVKPRAQDVEVVFILRVHSNFAVIEGPRVDVGDALPTLAFVLRAEEPALAAFLFEAPCAAAHVGLKNGIDHIGILAVDVEADAAQWAGGKALGQLLPGLAPVGGFIDARARPTAREVPRRATALVGGRINNVRVRRIQGHVHHARVGVNLQDSRPCLAAVGGFVKATFLVWSPEVPEGRYVHGVVLSRVDGDLADVVGVLEPHVRPGLAAVGGLIDAVSPGGTVAVIGFARSHPDEIGVGLGDRYRPDRGDSFTFKNR